LHLAIEVSRRFASRISSSWLHGIARYFGSTPSRGAVAILLFSTQHKPEKAELACELQHFNYGGQNEAV